MTESAAPWHGVGTPGVGGAAVGANVTCALRLWEGLKLWLYANITSDVMLMGEQASLSASDHGPCNHHAHGGPCIATQLVCRTDRRW